MLVSLQHRLVVLATPKCASTAMEDAFAAHVDVVISGHPKAKHTPFRKYDRFLKRFFETVTDDPLEVVCLFRDPVDWLQSWWRYRSREALLGKPQSTRGMTFDDFARAYVAEENPASGLGSQAQFVSDKNGAVGVDRIWRYDHVDGFAEWIADRLGVSVALDRVNVSPGPADTAGLSCATQGLIERRLERDFEIYSTTAL